MVRLKQIAIPIKCPASWDAMTGSDSVRRCGTCRKDVYNLSEMTEAEAHAVLDAGEERCVRFYYRPDGTIVTSRCADGARGTTRAAALGVAASLAAFSTLTVSLPDPPAPVAASSADGLVAMGGMLHIAKDLKRPRKPEAKPAADSEPIAAEPVAAEPVTAEPVADVRPALAPVTPAPIEPPAAAASSRNTLVAVLSGLLAALAFLVSFGAVKLGKPR